MGKADKKLPTESQQPGAGNNVTSIDSAREGRAKVAVVVFGRDEGGRPHASRFEAADAELAVKAAALMGFRVLPITGDQQRAAASAVAVGRIFGSGKAFAPFCTEAAHEALAAFAEAYSPLAPGEPESAPAPAVTGTPGRWEDVGVGSLVLAAADPQTGWWPAVVSEVRGEGLFVMKWQGQDWEGEASFVRRLDGLALLPTPAAAGA